MQQTVGAGTAFEGALEVAGVEIGGGWEQEFESLQIDLG